jgi:hypothetical protein
VKLNWEKPMRSLAIAVVAAAAFGLIATSHATAGHVCRGLNGHWINCPAVNPPQGLCRDPKTHHYISCTPSTLRDRHP